MKPITPNEIGVAKLGIIPSDVIACFNEQIAKNWGGGSSVVKQNAVVEAIAAKMGIPRESVFEKKYLEVEDIYRDAGWRVEYDKPAYNESYEASFTFTRKRESV